MSSTQSDTTPDGRYFVVRGRLWRTSNPNLKPAEREKLVHELMVARRKILTAIRQGDGAAEAKAREEVDRSKRALGERGPVWWNDGQPDLNRRMVRATPYAPWFAQLSKGATSN